MVELRGSGVNLPARGDKVGLPPRPFLYTVDQLAVILEVAESTIKARYLYYEGRSTGRRLPSLMLAHNIAPSEDKPEWRVAEREFIRWMRSKGFKFYERSAFSS